LKGRARLAARALLTVAMGTIVWIIIDLKHEGAWTPSAGGWLLTVTGTAVAVGGMWLLATSLRSWRNAKRLLIGATSAASLVALAYTVEDVRGWLAWNHFKAKWEAKGEKFDFSAWVPAQVPEDKNFAMAPVVYSAYGEVLDKAGHRTQNAHVINRLLMPIGARNDGPTNGIGNWQKGVRGDLAAWQAYYRGLALPDENQNPDQDRVSAAFARRYGLKPVTFRPPPTTNFPVAPTPQTAAKDVLLALSIYDQTIEDLRKAAALPETRFPLNWDAELPPIILLPHLASMKGCSLALRLRAAAELADGRGDAAADDIVLALKLTEKLRGEPFLISHLVRIAMLNLITQPIWEGIVDHRWNDAQLAKLQEPLGKFDFLKDYRLAMRGENACHATTISYLMHHPGKLSEMESVGDAPSHSLEELAGWFAPAGWYRQNELTCAKFVLEKYLPIADEDKGVFYPSLADKAGHEVTEISAGPYTCLGRMLLPSMVKGAQKFAQAQAAVNLSLAACAAERYHLAHGKYPASLAETVPGFVAKVPGDPFGEVGAGPKPLRYQATEGGKFIAYAVGWNLTDDGGKRAFNQHGAIDPDHGDVVWAFPE